MPIAFRDILLKLCRREELSREEAAAVFDTVMAGGATDAQVGGLLVGLAAKGSTVDELVGAATAMRKRVVPVETDVGDVVLDTCGTGGDVKGTFNISTAAAIVAAAAGVKVVKHGNRSAASKTGSADVLEALGVRLDVSPDAHRRRLNEAGMTFAFARNHHPAMAAVAAVRSSLGIPTLFNILGPLTNPAGAKHQLLGVFARELTDRLANVLLQLGSKRAWVVHADDGLDELSTMGPTYISELNHGRVSGRTLDPTSLGLPIAKLDDLRVDTAAESAAVIRSVLAGRPGPQRDIVLLNGAAAVVIAGKSESLETALPIVSTAVDSGAARNVLSELSTVG